MTCFTKHDENAKNMFDDYTPPISFHSSYLIDLYACDASPIYSMKSSLTFTPFKKPMSKFEILQPCLDGKAYEGSC
jgi:hypothetical protein